MRVFEKFIKFETFIVVVLATDRHTLQRFGNPPFIKALVVVVVVAQLLLLLLFFI